VQHQQSSLEATGRTFPGVRLLGLLPSHRHPFGESGQSYHVINTCLVSLVQPCHLNEILLVSQTRSYQLSNILMVNLPQPATTSPTSFWQVTHLGESTRTLPSYWHPYGESTQILPFPWHSYGVSIITVISISL